MAHLVQYRLLTQRRLSLLDYVDFMRREPLVSQVPPPGTCEFSLNFAFHDLRTPYINPCA